MKWAYPRGDLKEPGLHHSRMGARGEGRGPGTGGREVKRSNQEEGIRKAARIPSGRGRCGTWLGNLLPAWPGTII